MSKLIIEDGYGYFSMNDILKNLFALGIADNESVRSEIDKIFNTDKIKYLKAYKNSEIYKSVLTKSTTPIKALYAEKVIGIVEVAIQENNITDMFNLYKRAFRHIYNNIRYLKEVNLIKDVVPHARKNVQGSNDYIVTAYMYTCLNQLSNDESQWTILNNLLQQIVILEVYNNSNFSQDIINHHQDDIQELKQYFGIGKKCYRADELLTQILDKDLKRYNSYKVLTPDEMLSDTYAIEKIGPVGKYVGASEGLCKNLQIYTDDAFSSVTLSRYDINCILMNYLYAVKFNSLNENDKNSFIVYTLYMYVINKLYSSLKDDYLLAVNDEDIIKLDEAQKQCAAEKAKAQKAESSAREKEKIFVEKETSLFQTIEALKKENKRLNDELQSQKDLKNEVIKLRNIVFNGLEMNESDNSMDAEDIDIEILNNKNTVILGGHTSWVSDMKKVLPNAIFWGAEARNSNMDFIKSNSLVFINTKMPHSLYFKVKETISKVGATYYYINSNSNIQLTKKEMIENLQHPKE